MIILLLLVLLTVKIIDLPFKGVILNEELQRITNGEALKGGEEVLTGNVEALKDNEKCVNVRLGVLKGGGEALKGVKERCVKWRHKKH